MRRLVFTGWPRHSGAWAALVALWALVGATWRQRCPSACLRCDAQRGGGM